MSPISAQRKTFAADKDLLFRMRGKAGERGVSLYGLVNEVFETWLKAQDLGLGLRPLVEDQERLRAARDGGFILGLESVWYEMAEIAYEKGRDRALQSWSDAGAWLARRHASRDTADPLSAFRRSLTGLTWNGFEMDMEREGDRVSIRLLNPRFSESYTFLYVALLEGALGNLGYRTSSTDVSPGTIRLQALKD